MQKVVEKDQKCLVFVIYVGDGGIDLRQLNTYAVIKKTKMFALEHFVRQLSLIKNSYVVAYYQCPRQQI